MDVEYPLATLVKLRDSLKESLREAIRDGEISPESRNEVLARLSAIQQKIDLAKSLAESPANVIPTSQIP